MYYYYFFFFLKAATLQSHLYAWKRTHVQTFTMAATNNYFHLLFTFSVNHLDCKMSEDNKKKMVSMTFTSLGSPSVLTFDWLEPVNVCFFFWTDKWPEQLSVSALLHII